MQESDIKILADEVAKRMKTERQDFLASANYILDNRGIKSTDERTVCLKLIGGILGKLSAQKRAENLKRKKEEQEKPIFSKEETRRMIGQSLSLLKKRRDNLVS